MQTKKLFSLFKNSSGLLGVTIDDTTIRLVELTKYRNNYQVERCYVTRLATATSVTAIATSLMALIENQKCLTRRIAFALPYNKVTFKEIFLERNLGEEKLIKFLEFTGAKELAQEEHAIIFDYYYLPTKKNQGVKLQLVAVEREQVTSWFNPMVAAGFSVPIIDVDGYALARVVGRQEHGVGAVVAAVNIEVNTILFVVLGQGQIMYMAQDLLTAETGATVTQVAALLALKLELILANLSSPLTKIILSGSRATLPNLASVLQAQLTGLEIPILILDPFVGMQWSSAINYEEVASLAPTLAISCGLALRSGRW